MGHPGQLERIYTVATLYQYYLMLQSFGNPVKQTWNRSNQIKASKWILGTSQLEYKERLRRINYPLLCTRKCMSYCCSNKLSWIRTTLNGESGQQSWTVFTLQNQSRQHGMYAFFLNHSERGIQKLLVQPQIVFPMILTWPIRFDDSLTTIFLWTDPHWHFQHLLSFSSFCICLLNNFLWIVEY